MLHQEMVVSFDSEYSMLLLGTLKNLIFIEYPPDKNTFFCWKTVFLRHLLIVLHHKNNNVYPFPCHKYGKDFRDRTEQAEGRHVVKLKRYYQMVNQRHNLKKNSISQLLKLHRKDEYATKQKNDNNKAKNLCRTCGNHCSKSMSYNIKEREIKRE